MDIALIDTVLLRIRLIFLVTEYQYKLLNDTRTVYFFFLSLQFRDL
jgi:hypothetical protein